MVGAQTCPPQHTSQAALQAPRSSSCQHFAMGCPVGTRHRSLLRPGSSGGTKQQHLPPAGAARSFWHRPCHERAIKHQLVAPSSSQPGLAQAAEAQRGRETRLLHTDCGQGTASPRNPSAPKAAWFIFREKGSPSCSYESMASSCHPQRTVLRTTNPQSELGALLRAREWAFPTCP